MPPVSDSIAHDVKVATQRTLQSAAGALEPHVPAEVKRRVRRALPRRFYKYLDPGWHRRAIGGMWDTMGKLQFDYLVQQGLKPHHYLLDVGCGPLRGGWRFIEYLDEGRYHGIDRRWDLIEAGIDFDLRPRGLMAKRPVLTEEPHFRFSRLGRRFDYALAQSVFTHLSVNEITRCLMRMEQALEPGGKFFATFYENERGKRNLDDVEQQPGLVTHFDRDFFHYDLGTFEWICRDTELEVEYLGGWNNPRNQKMLCFTRVQAN